MSVSDNLSLISLSQLGQIIDSLEKWLEVGDDRIRLMVRHVVLDDLAVAVDEELGEVPRDVAAVQLRVLAHVLVHWHAAWSVDRNLLEEWERHVVLGDELLDGRSILWLLTAELVAWNSVDFQALVLVLFVKSLQLLVVAIGQTSERGDVDEEKRLFVFSVLSDCAQALAIDVIDLISMYIFDASDWNAIFHPNLILLGESLTVGSELWVVVQAFGELVDAEWDLLIVDEVRVNVANPEVSD